MNTFSFSNLWKHEYFRTALTILLIIGVVFGFWFSLTQFLGVEHPLLVVVSGSMCMVDNCDGWSHPFEPTLHSGDLIVVQGIAADAIILDTSPPFIEI